MPGALLPGAVDTALPNHILGTSPLHDCPVEGCNRACSLHFLTVVHSNTCMMAYQLSIPPCCHDPADPTHSPALGQPLRIQIEGPKVSIDKLLPGISWQTSVATPTFPQPAGPKLAALAFKAVYGQPPDTDDMIVRDEYLGLIMKPQPTG